MKRGRPTLKTQERVAKILELAMSGRTDAQISEIVGIGERTLRDWKVQDWQFSAALKENKDIADDVVEASLYKNAVGFHYLEEASTREGVISLQKYSVPNTTAQIYWLNNRRPTKWKTRVEVQNEPRGVLTVTSKSGRESKYKR